MIEPALTAEQWKNGWVYAQDEPGASSGEHVHRHANDPSSVCVASLMSHACVSDPGCKHALAALCLDGEPFGFTREDLSLLRTALAVWPNLGSHTEAELTSLIKRIEALVPPEATNAR